MRHYIPPTPYSCSACGVAVVSEFGTLDYDAYQDGIVRKHWCIIPDIAPLNQREYEALLANLDPPPRTERPKPKVPAATPPRPKKFTR